MNAVTHPATITYQGKTYDVQVNEGLTHVPFFFEGPRGAHFSMIRNSNHAAQFSVTTGKSGKSVATYRLVDGAFRELCAR